MSNQQFVMVLERSGENLSVKKGDNDEYVLEGVFAQFGVENNNHRIYEEKEYLPHMDYLKKKISENRLLGELDHPEKFDISLNKVSHLIEEIKYDSKKRQIVGKIKLLDTPSGQIAKNLVDSGIPISISSRAAGVVGENKKVQIKRIFTYDLVADPGFENAQMKRINESLGFGDDDSLAIYDMNDRASLSFMESLQEAGANNNITEKTSTKMAEFVTIDDMNKYSLILKEEIEKINGRIEKISESTDREAQLVALASEVENLKEYASYLAEEQNKSVRYSDYLAEKLDSGIAYTEHIAERADKGIQYAESISEKVGKVVEYSEHIAERMDQTIQFTDYLAEKQNEGLAFADYLAEKLGNSIGYAEHIAEHADNSIRYSEYLAENAASSSDFKALTEYTEYLVENINGTTTSKSDISEDDDNAGPAKRKTARGILNGAVDESNRITSRYSSLDNKIKNVLESIEKQRMEANSLDKTYPFVKFLGEEKRNAFTALSEADKMRVTHAYNAKPVYEETAIVLLWEASLAKTEVNEKWLTDMPTEYIPLWESASDELKERIIRQAQVYRMESAYQIKNFWQTRGLGTTFLQEAGTINENHAVEPLKGKSLSTLGYTEDYVESIKQGLNRYKR